MASTPPENRDARRDVVAAGAVVFRPGRRVLLVHRPKYDDWSFPKGKVDRGEHLTAAAVREVEEETGVHVRLGPRLGRWRYPVGKGIKTVHYWTARAVGDDDVSGYAPNDEVDGVAWLDADEAAERLSYDHDRVTLQEALGLRRRTRALVVLRHGPARARKTWRADDRLRPLLQTGRQQAHALVPVLAAFGVTRVVSSSSTRCVETVAPYASLTGFKLEEEDRLSEEDATRKSVRRLVDELRDGPATGEGLVLCTHRPVLPWVFEALGVEDPRLEPGEMLVTHLRKGTVAATERHLPR